MRFEQTSRDKRHSLADAFDDKALALLPHPQRALLKHWLKSKAQKPTWDTLLKIAIKHGGQEQIEVAESLALSLADCGAAILEQRREHAAWINRALIWRDYEAVCASLGLVTQAAQRNTFSTAWTAAQQIDWQRAALSDAYQSLREAPADRGPARLALLVKLNEWLLEGNSGTRREFSLFARGQTKKQISTAEWAWLAEIAELAECGIERHAPALWLAGDIQLKFNGRWLDVGAAGDFIALTPTTLNTLTEAKTGAMHYRVIENRTSFENVVRKTPDAGAQIVLWLPGYAPSWWRAAVSRLIAVLPAPARISCDADPDGVQIALNAGELWTEQGLEWEPYAMSAEDAAGARHKLPLTERDARLADALLIRPGLPPFLKTLLQWCLDRQCKAEQENWL